MTNLKNIPQRSTLVQIIVTILLFVFSLLLLNTAFTQFAKAADNCPAGQALVYQTGTGAACQPISGTANAAYGTGLVCTGGGLTMPKCVGKGPYKCTAPGTECLKNNPIVLWISFFINLLASVIGIGAIIMVIVAGLQYSAARDNPQAIQAAKQKMTNVLIGLAAFIFMYAFLQWLIPGGVF